MSEKHRACIIGVSTYPSGIANLPAVASDVREIAKLLGSEDGTFEETEIAVVADADATRLRILDQLLETLGAAAPGDTVFVYLAGHGALDSDGRYYFIPHDARLENLRESAVALTEIKEIFDGARSERVLLWLDFCHSGGVLARKLADEAEQEAVSSIERTLRATEGRGRVIMCACTADQSAYEGPDHGHFTKYLVAGLRGAAANAAGEVTPNSLHDYIDREIGSARQRPMFFGTMTGRIVLMHSNRSPLTHGTVTSTKNLIWDGMTICEERNAINAVTKMYFDSGVQISGSNYYYTRDHLGSIREMTTGTNAIIKARYDYDPYGQQTQLIGSGTTNADFGFTGQYSHQPSGLVLAPYREYSGSLGRFLSRDPIGERGGINLYDYVLNNPMNLIDPTGLLSDAAQAIVNSALDQSHGDIAGAYANVLNQRRGNSKCEPLRDAEHYLAAAAITQEMGLLGAASMAVGTTGYTPLKALGLAGDDDASPASLGEMAAGYEGIGYGLTHPSLAPSGCNGLYNSNGAELPGYMGP